MLLEITALVDARGLPAPAALSRARQVLTALGRGSVIEVLVTATEAPPAIDAWCRGHGHVIVEQSADGVTHRLVIERA